ncbi:MAG TPA: 2-C-methyl-D-erythritol 2,4-cyclodiphosphate synthase [Fimbriimonadaceae bacterium]|nr:2-C-methyl-D-erythritol 2,4-cyclodiphosphate synthase [Fimbriimonadaceae bacterium]
MGIPPASLGGADVGVVIVAAGSSSRFGADKMRLPLGGKPLWRWSYELFRAHPAVREVIVVGSSNLGDVEHRVDGGASRQESSRRGVSAISADAEYILVHDAARPFVTRELVDAVIEGCRQVGAAAPVVPVVDTLRSSEPGVAAPDRAKLVAMQTPQGARAEWMRRAHAEVSAERTDEIALIEAIGEPWQPVPGSPRNFKVTVPEDFERAQTMMRTETRTGFGYDVHRFSAEPNRPLWLGGVHFPDHPGLEGHSDADALLHAITDALLGAAVLGDIGQHFPPGDPEWKDRASVHFLRAAGELLRADGWEVAHVDSTVIAESPKLMPRAREIRSVVANALGITDDQVSVKATTNEGLGAIGRGEGIAAYATATIRRSLPNH